MHEALKIRHEISHILMRRRDKAGVTRTRSTNPILRMAESSRRPAADAWSPAVANVALLHLQLSDALWEGAEPQSLKNKLNNSGNVGSLLSEVQAHGQRSGDPTLRSEALMLRAAWSAAKFSSASPV